MCEKIITAQKPNGVKSNLIIFVPFFVHRPILCHVMANFKHLLPIFKT